MQERDSNTGSYIGMYEGAEILKRYKGMISKIFISAVVITATISFFIPKIYQATNYVLIIAPNAKQDSVNNNITDSYKNIALTSYAGQKAVISIPTHKVLLFSDAVLNKVIEKLNLTDKSGEKLSVEKLAKRLSIKEARETNVLRLQACAPTPAEAKSIANAWAEEYVKYNQGLIADEVVGKDDAMSDEYSDADKKLSAAEDAVRKFRDECNIDILKAELDLKKDILIANKKELLSLNSDLITKKEYLYQLKTGIEKQPRFIIVSKAITDDALWQLKSKNQGLQDFENKKLSSEEINPIYRDLECRIVNTEIDINSLTPRAEYLKRDIESGEKDISDSDRVINEKELEFKRLLREVEICGKRYDKVTARMSAGDKSDQLGEVRIVSYAYEPKYPIVPKIASYVFLTGIFSLIFGMFAALFLDAIRKK